MPLYLREFEGYDIKESDKYTKKTIQYSHHHSIDHKESAIQVEPVTFKVGIEALHCYPFATRNYTRYMKEACKKSLKSWTEPYGIPTIMYHNDYDGVINGRIIEASMGKSPQTDNGDCLILTASAPHWHTQEDITTGILKTVSVGVSAKDVRCSICGNQLSEGEWCDHTRGYKYDGQVCYWDVYDFEAKELSYVIVPSDKFAQIISIDRLSWEEATGKDNKEKIQRPQRIFSLYNQESEQDIKNNNSEHKEDIDSNNNVDISESSQIDVREKDTNPENVTNTEEIQKENDVELNEALKKIESMETENKALVGDKEQLQTKIDTLNKDKTGLQESLKDLQTKMDEKELTLIHEKEMREAAEKKVQSLESEVKNSLVESLTTLRDKAGKPKLEKLEERSIDSLRDSIADLRAEMKEAEEKAKNEETQKTKGIVEDPTLKESEEKKTAEQEKKDEPVVAEDFDL